MISINNLSVSFGGFLLFDEVNFHINENDRIGLVGRNGSGKTTLLKIVAGVSTPSSGDIQRPAQLTIGYLPQEMGYTKNSTVIDEAMQAFSHIKALDKELAAVNRAIYERDDYESDSYRNLLIKLNEITDKLSIYASSNPRAEAERVILGLGFGRDELERKRAELSVGWNMRIELAKVLLRKPDILLLDEPTNHLDIESIRWLESYLTGFKGAIILISHDRRFLDSITNRTVEIVLGKMHDYKVSYTKYQELRKERFAQQKAAFDNQQKMIEKTEEFIEKFRYKPTKSNQVQSRIKQLEKIDRIEIEEDDKSALHLKFPPAPRSGQVVVKATDLAMAFGPKKIFSNVNIIVERGDKIALVGKNGQGKTTFMRLVTEELLPVAGKIAQGHNVSIGYYAQNQEDLLDKNDTVLETLDKIAVGDVRTKLRDILGAFLFRGDDVDKKVSVLSGGERARLAMAKLILKPCNLLLLDEPTNHMDIISKDILKTALKNYGGTLIIVSHDRDFLDGLAHKLYEFKEGAAIEHLGGLDGFLYRKNIESFDELETPLKKDKPTSMREESLHKKNVFVNKATIKESNIAVKEDPALSYQEQREIEREARRKKTKIEKCESKITDIENKIEKIEQILSNNHNSVSLPDTLNTYQELKEALDKKLEEWEELHD
ncbi:MAG: ABC-F family ATP-binding cassette domain-containing protein [Bacteroidales bacterium]